jgi:hypothetical protein
VSVRSTISRSTGTSGVYFAARRGRLSPVAWNSPTALSVLATFANLRFGELAALRRGQLDLDACEVRVNASTWEMDDGRLIDGDPKSGHSSPRAALIYLHATRERDQKIAAGMGRIFAEAMKASTSKSGSTPKPSGTQQARRPGRAT